MAGGEAGTLLDPQGGDDPGTLRLNWRVDTTEVERSMSRLATGAGRAERAFAGIRGMQGGDRHIRQLATLLRRDMTAIAQQSGTGPGGGGDMGGAIIGGSVNQRANDSRARRARFAFGSEGIRAGNLRLSRSGVSLSEKTFLSTPVLGMGAAFGQVAGGISEHMILAWEEYQRGGSLGHFVAKSTLGVVGRVGRLAASLFGIEKLGAAAAWVLTSASYEEAQGMVRGLVDVVTLEANRWSWFESQLHQQRTDRAAAIQRGIQHWERRRSETLKQYPQDTRSRLDAIFDRAAIVAHRAQYIMTRDINNRPLWQVANVPFNAGR